MYYVSPSTLGMFIPYGSTLALSSANLVMTSFDLTTSTFEAVSCGIETEVQNPSVFELYLFGNTAFESISLMGNFYDNLDNEIR